MAYGLVQINQIIMMNFFKPICTTLKHLYEVGIEVNSPDVQDPFTCRAMLLASTFDLPAKAVVLNMAQFNGEYGCTKCLQSGERIATSRGGSVRVFPYQVRDPMGPIRSHSTISEDAKVAFETGTSQNGVKGPC